MGVERRRSGFRLSWTASDKGSEAEERPDAAATEAATGAVETMTTDTPAADPPAAESPTGESASPATPAGDSPTTEAAVTGAASDDAQADAPKAAETAVDDAPEPAAADEPAGARTDAAGGTADGDSNEFMVSLVGAMRGVAETSRDASLEELRTSVDAHIEQLGKASAQKESDLRRAADLDLQGVADWERTETERIRSEAESRRDARRTKLDQQLAEHRAASERAVEATRQRLADHERELAAFFAQLGEISDPAAFVAAAKRMPQPPDLSMPGASAGTSPPAAAPATEPSAEQRAAATPEDPRLAAMGVTGDEPTPEATASTDPAAAAGASDASPAPAADVEGDVDNRLAARLAQLDQRIAGETQPVAAAAPAPSNGGEASTAVIVKGLGSFGAITSFKQALERVEGVRGVTLSLGPTGEFVYRASHAADFDMVAAVQSVEGPSATVEDTDGTLVVTLSRAR